MNALSKAVRRLKNAWARHRYTRMSEAEKIAAENAYLRQMAQVLLHTKGTRGHTRLLREGVRVQYASTRSADTSAEVSTDSELVAFLVEGTEWESESHARCSGD